MIVYQGIFKQFIHTANIILISFYKELVNEANTHDRMVDIRCIYIG